MKNRTHFNLRALATSTALLLVLAMALAGCGTASPHAMSPRKQQREEQEAARAKREAEEKARALGDRCVAEAARKAEAELKLRAAAMENQRYEEAKAAAAAAARQAEAQKMAAALARARASGASVKCLDFTTRKGWLELHPDLAANRTAWGKRFATLLVEAINRRDRPADAVGLTKAEVTAELLVAMRYVCSGELLWVQPPAMLSAAGSQELTLMYEYRSSERGSSVVMDKQLVSVERVCQKPMQPEDLDALLKDAAGVVASRVAAKAPSSVTASR